MVSVQSFNDFNAAPEKRNKILGPERLTCLLLLLVDKMALHYHKQVSKKTDKECMKKKALPVMNITPFRLSSNRIPSTSLSHFGRSQGGRDSKTNLIQYTQKLFDNGKNDLVI